MYSIQARHEETVIEDNLPTRRVLHAVPDLEPEAAAPVPARPAPTHTAPTHPAPTHSGAAATAPMRARAYQTDSPGIAPAEQTRRALHNDTRSTAKPIASAASTAAAPTRSSRRNTYMAGATAHQLESARSADSSPAEALPAREEASANHTFDSATRSAAAQQATRRTQNAQLHQRAATGAFPAIKPRPKTGVMPALTEEQAVAQTRRNALTQPALKRQRPTPQVFNVEDYGPLSPESEDLTTANAQSPLDLREPSLAELMWLQEMRYHLRTPQQPALTVAELSKTYNDYCTAWNAAPKEARWDQSFAVTSIGIAIGDHLVESTVDCHWMVSESNGALVFGVRDDAKKATYFPIDAVNRRWFAAKLDWIPGFIRNAREH